MILAPALQSRTARQGAAFNRLAKRVLASFLLLEEGIGEMEFAYRNGFRQWVDDDYLRDEALSYVGVIERLRAAFSHAIGSTTIEGAGIIAEKDHAASFAAFNEGDAEHPPGTAKAVLGSVMLAESVGRILALGSVASKRSADAREMAIVAVMCRCLYGIEHLVRPKFVVDETDLPWLR